MKINLDDIEKKKQPFQAPPEQYFENLPLQIKGKIKSKDGVEWSRIGLTWKLGLAVLPLLILAFYFLYTPADQQSVDEILAKIPDYELLAYVEQMDLDLAELTKNLPESWSEGLGEMNGIDEVEIDSESINDLLFEYDLDTEYL